jgi:ABC-2 type transport system ATP-binding protein
LYPGELVAILGPNGAGKTTLLSILAGQRSPTSGTVTGPPPRKRGWVPQSGGIWARLTVRENLKIFAKLTQSNAESVVETARSVGLEDRLSTIAANLSGGMRQRLNIACGLIDNPPVLLLDEPTTGLDVVHRAELWSILKSRQSDGTCIAFSTHSLEDAVLADRVLVIAHGVVAYSGTPQGLSRFAKAGADSNHLIEAGLIALWKDASLISNEQERA